MKESCNFFDFSEHLRLRNVLSGQTHYVHTELEFIVKFDAEIDQYLVHKYVEAATKGDDAILSAPKYQREEMREDIEEELLMITDSMPFLLRHSLFISQYTVLESHMNSLCRIMQRHKRIQVDVSDFSGAGITRGKEYLEKAIEVDFPSSHHTWRNLQIYNQLRNIMVHANGEIVENNNNKKIKNYVIKHPSLELSPLNTIRVLGAFIQEVATDISDFVTVLSENIVEKYDPYT